MNSNRKKIMDNRNMLYNQLRAAQYNYNTYSKTRDSNFFWRLWSLQDACPSQFQTVTSGTQDYINLIDTKSEFENLNGLPKIRVQRESYSDSYSSKNEKSYEKKKINKYRYDESEQIYNNLDTRQQILENRLNYEEGTTDPNYLKKKMKHQKGYGIPEKSYHAAVPQKGQPYANERFSSEKYGNEKYYDRDNSYNYDYYKEEKSYGANKAPSRPSYYYDNIDERSRYDYKYRDERSAMPGANYRYDQNQYYSDLENDYRYKFYQGGQEYPDQYEGFNNGYNTWSGISNQLEPGANVPLTYNEDYSRSRSGFEYQDNPNYTKETYSESRCMHCGTTETSLWRRLEGQVVCNACGLYFKMHGVKRPSNLKSGVIKKRRRVSKKERFENI